MANDVLRKVQSYLRQIEKLAEKGDLEGVKLEARLALRLCDDDPSVKGLGGGT